MKAYTEIDFKQLFVTSEAFDGWLENEFLEVRSDGTEPGVWLRVKDIERMPTLHRSERDTYLGRHPRHDLNLPVLPFPFTAADFQALADSDCFRHCGARWPSEGDVERLRGINPRTATLMTALLAEAESVPTVLTAGPAPLSETPKATSHESPPSSGLRHSTIGARRDILTPVIEFAQQQCLDRLDTAEVWARLQRMAEEEHVPLLASTSEGVKYLSNGCDRYLTRDALYKRLRLRLRRETDAT